MPDYIPSKVWAQCSNAIERDCARRANNALEALSKWASVELAAQWLSLAEDSLEAALWLRRPGV